MTETGGIFLIRRPDDWHVHLRDKHLLQAVARYTARQFGRAIIMPNLDPPITTRKQLREYRQRIKEATWKFPDFDPKMTLYLTDNLDINELVGAFQSGEALAVKLYPQGATTNSDLGVTSIKKVYPVIEVMQKIGMPFCIHGETVWKDGEEVYGPDREAVFIEYELIPLMHDFPELKIVFEHVTTKEAVEFVMSVNKYLGATITAHHPFLNGNILRRGGFHPHDYCLPEAKKVRDQLAVRSAAVSGDPRFFAGTDSAPHLVRSKESACCPGGVFTAPAALELYAQLFDEEDALDRLEAFVSEHGALFYGLPLNTETVMLTKKPWDVDMVDVPEAEDTVRPFMWRNKQEREKGPEGPIKWRMVD